MMSRPQPYNVTPQFLAASTPSPPSHRVFNLQRAVADLNTTSNSDSSAPYAGLGSVGGEGDLHLVPTRPPRYTGRSGSSRTTSFVISSYVCGSHHKELRALNDRLRRRVHKLGKILALLVVLFVVTFIPLFVLHPHARREFSNLFSVTRDSGWGEGSWGQRARGNESSFPEHVYGTCVAGAGAAGLHDMDMGMALCLLKETKTGLDRRTRQLDTEVDTMKTKILHLTYYIQSITADRNISVVYDLRPSIHLFLYYSHTYQSCQDSNILQWTQKSSFNTIRFVGVQPHSCKGESKVIAGIRVTHPGHYFVYSQVTYKRTTGIHSLFLTRSTDGRRQKLISVTRGSNSGHVSTLQGIFGLCENDTLSVMADYKHIDTFNRDATFFGAFRV